MFRFAFLAGIAYFIGRIAYTLTLFVFSILAMALLLGGIFYLDTIRLSAT